MKIRFKKTSDKALMPKKHHVTDAGHDLYVTSIKKRSLFKIHYKLGLCADFPEGCYAEVYPRSSIHKRYLILSNSVGVIDNGYTGEWQAVFYKIPFLSKPYKVGDACCQAIFKFMQDRCLNIESTDYIKCKDRGDNGFGSTDS